MGRSSLELLKVELQKEGKKQKQKKNIEKHRKLDGFLLKTESHANSSTSANFTNSGISEEANLSDVLEDSIEVAQFLNEQSELDKVTDIQKDLPLNRKSDPGLWANLSAEDIQFWIESGQSTCQNADNDFKSSKMTYQDRDRYCSKSLFVGKK